MEKKNFLEKKYSLYLDIKISESSAFIYNKKEILFEYKFIQAENTFLILKEDHKTLIKSNQYDIKRDENLIFYIKYLSNNDIELFNAYDECYKCDIKKLYKKQYNLNYKLWRAVPSYINEDEESDFYLQENDIIRLGDIKIILREINIKGYKSNNINNKNKKIFVPKLKDKSNNEQICSICKKGDLGQNNPLLELCFCDKDDNKYRHLLCHKEKINNSKNINEQKGCIRYLINTNCIKCGKFTSVNFYVDNDIEINYYELIDIPKNKDEDYLLFETLDFQEDTNKYYIKYFFYVKIDDNTENIIIGRKNEGEYKYDKLIQIEGNQKLSGQHALIEYDKETKKLKLKNISDKHNTLVLQEKIILKNKDLLNVELGNIKIEGRLINNDNLNNKEDDNKNENLVEIRNINI